MYRSKILKMDLTTTKAHDYQAHNVSPTKPDKYKPPEYSVKFTGKSRYQADFPNWGPYEVLYMKHFNVPTRTDMLKVNSQTTYSTNFKPTHPEPLSEEVQKQKYERLYKSSPLSSTDRFYSETTAKKFYIDPRKSNIKSQIMRMREDPLHFGVHDTHFKTLYKTDFDLKPVQQHTIPTRRMATSNSTSRLG
mmetsp:Transcript_5398/g.9982  ORF Transcript_5398/g.9982 Transcript_5398/m.9982 type:complete len:191 (-) Transcript_5398:25-597(-)